MAGAKIVVLYPYPQNIDTFERAYTEDHVPMVNPQMMKGITRFVHTKMVGTPDGSTPPFYRMAELYFPSLEALKSCATSESAQKVVAHAVSISTGGMPIVLIAEEETINF